MDGVLVARRSRPVFQTFEYESSASNQLPDTYDIRFSRYEHSWLCNRLTCKSIYNWDAFIVDLKTGEKVLLRAVEVAMAIQDGNTPISYNPEGLLLYKYHSLVTDFHLHRGEQNGHDPHYWGVAKCYFMDGEIISWRFNSHA
jgi:hypothetical protein